MNPVSHAIVGLPALIGVFMGLKLYLQGRGFAVGVPIALLVIAFSSRTLGLAIVNKYTKVARWALEIWILAAIAVTAFATALVMWISLDFPLKYILDTSVVPTDQVKTISGSFIGAITTYTALVWTKDIGDAQGMFWPSTQFKNAMNVAYQNLPAAQKPDGASVTYQAMYQDTVAGHGNIGWNFEARGIRANIVSNYVANLNPNPNP